MKIVSSSDTLASHLPAAERLSAFSSVAPYTGPSITNPTAGIGALAWFIWNQAKNEEYVAVSTV